MIDYGIKIKELRIKRFRLFDDIKLVFNDENYYSFLGRNATGKTSLLEAINVCLSANTSKYNTIKESDFYNDEPIEISVEFNKPFFLSHQDPPGIYKRLLPCRKFTKIIRKRERKSPGDFFSSEYQIDWQFELMLYDRLKEGEYNKFCSDCNSYLDKNELIVWSLQQDETSKGYIYTIKSNEGDKFVSDYEIQYLDRVLFPQVFYFDKNRDRELLAEYKTVFSNIVNELDWRYKKQLLKNSADKKVLLGRYDLLHNKIVELSDYQKQLLAPAMKILKDELMLDFNVDNLEFFFLNFEEPFRRSIFGQKTLNNKLLDIDKMGSGVSILLALSILVNFAEQGKKSIIVLIDEPELHLHADLQKQLFNFLKNRNFQTFVSTHSHLFADKSNFENNLSIQKNSLEKVIIEQCNQISLANAIFGSFGNSLDDLYVPENIILVGGKYDKQILIKVLSLLGGEEKSLLILECGGDEGIPNKGDLIEKFFETYINKDCWYSNFISKNFRVIVDGDVKTERVAGWVKKYNLGEKIKHLDKLCLEYLYPVSVIKELVKDITLKDGSLFFEKTVEEIVRIILNDEKYRSSSKTQGKVIQKQEYIISKQRLTELVCQNLTKEILQSEEGAGLRTLGEWIMK